MRTVLVTVAVIIVAVVAMSYLFLRNGALAADRTPGPVETFAARRLVRLSIPSSERSATNPFATNGNTWRDAVDHFGEHCASCHGADGRGHSDFGQLMYPPAPDLTSDAVQRFSDGELFAIISRGVRWTGMPAFRSSDSDEEIWKLVSLIRRLPALTAADLPKEPGGAHEHHHHEGPEKRPPK